MPETPARDFFEEALARFRQAETAEHDVRERSLEDLRFSLGDSDNNWQWDDAIYRKRDGRDEPCLTINVLQQDVWQVVNEARISRPQIRFTASDDKADIETAKIYDGLARQIQVHSDAESVWDTGVEFQVRSGFGWARANIQWADDRSFDQEIVFLPVPNPFQVYSDPSARKPDKSDMRWLFYIEDYTRERFAAEFGKVSTTDYSELRVTGWSGLLQSIGDHEAAWVTRDNIRVAEYWVIGDEPYTLCRLKNGRVIDKRLYGEELRALQEKDPGFEIEEEREAIERSVHFYKMTAREVLEETTWPGRLIPWFWIPGHQINVDGEDQVAGLVRNSKDAQRMYNSHSSNEAWVVATAPRVKYMAARGQTEGNERDWEDLNDPELSVVHYNAYNSQGQPFPVPPFPATNEAQIAALSAARAQAYEDVQRTTGRHEAVHGERSNERSGLAVRERRDVGGIVSFHYIDNLARAMRYAGRVLAEVIPEVYGPAQVARILGEDYQTEQRVMVMSSRSGGRTPEQLPDGIDRVYDLGAGKYDVTVIVGPSYATKRLEASEALMNLAKADPLLIQEDGDLLYRALDVPYAEEIAERRRKRLPPELQDNPDMDQVPPQLAALIQKYEKMLDVANDKLEQYQSGEIRMKYELQIKREGMRSDEAIAALRARTDVLKVLAQNESREAIALLQGEIARERDWLDVVAARVSAGEKAAAGNGASPG